MQQLRHTKISCSCFYFWWEPGSPGAVNAVNVVKQAKQPSSREAVSCRFWADEATEPTRTRPESQDVPERTRQGPMPDQGKMPTRRRQSALWPAAGGMDSRPFRTSCSSSRPWSKVLHIRKKLWLWCCAQGQGCLEVSRETWSWQGKDGHWADQHY